MADYRFTQESGTAFKVSTADKTDALEDTNEVRQIITDIGALLGHSKKDGSYPADATSGGDIDIRRITTKSAVATLTTGEAGFVKVSAAAGYTLTLPTAVGNKLTYIFVKTDANTNLITIDGAGTETINGALTYTDLNYQYAYVAIRSDNANWFVLSRSTNNLVTKTGTLVVGDLVKVNNASGIVEPTGIVAADVVKKTGTFTAGKVAKINNASGIIEMATNTDTEVAAAVTKKHTSGSETLIGDVIGTVGANVLSTVPVSKGGTGATVAQTAINTLSAVAGATNEHVLTKDTATGNVIFKVATGGDILPVVDTTGIAKGSVDATKIVRFEVDGLTTATTRVLTVPDKDLTLVGTVDKLSVFAATTSAELAGVISDETGNGLLVFGTSPSLVTPTISASRIRANRSTAQSIANSAWTIIQYNTEEYDNLGEYDNVTNYRFTATTAGYYAVTASAFTAAVAWDAAESIRIALFKNAAEGPSGTRTSAHATVTAYLGSTLATQIYLAAADYIDIRMYHDQGAAIDLHPSSGMNFFTVHRLS